MTFKCYVTLNGVKGLPLQDNVTLILTAKYSIADIDDMHRLLTRHVVGKKLRMALLRDGTTLGVGVVPSESPE